jgi:hypothetical protein
MAQASQAIKMHQPQQELKALAATIHAHHVVFNNAVANGDIDPLHIIRAAYKLLVAGARHGENGTLPASVAMPVVNMALALVHADPAIHCRKALYDIAQASLCFMPPQTAAKERVCRIAQDIPDGDLLEGASTDVWSHPPYKRMERLAITFHFCAGRAMSRHHAAAAVMDRVTELVDTAAGEWQHFFPTCLVKRPQNENLADHALVRLARRLVWYKGEAVVGQHFNAHPDETVQFNRGGFLVNKERSYICRM